MLGDTIKKLRIEKGLTQSELGEYLGVKKAAVQKYESGVVKNLKQDTIKKLSEVFEISPAMLIALGNEEKIRQEIILIEEIELTYGKEAVELLSIFTELSKPAQDKIVEYAKDMYCLRCLR